MNLTYDKVKPFITVPTTEASIDEAWLSSINAVLNARYGSRITDATEPLVLPYVGAAISRRLQPLPFGIKRQNVPGAGVEYDTAAASVGWFNIPELGELDSAFGVGGIRTHRTPVANAIRYGNLTSEDD